MIAKIEDEKNLNRLIYIIILIGFLFRLFHFFDNRSLWGDEAYLANSIITYDFKELAFKTLAYQQKAPIGFLYAVKMLTNIFGPKEMALRLFSLCASFTALIIFLPVCRFLLKPVGVLIAIGILAFSAPVIYHAVEVKQYETELLATIIALYLFTLFYKKTTSKSMVLWGVFGALLLWISFSIIFVLAGLAIGLSVYHLFKKDYKRFFFLVIPGGIWLLSFAVNYLLFTGKHADSDWLINWFKLRDGFMPMPPKSLADIKWFLQTIYRMMDYPLGLLWNFNSFQNPVLRVVFKLPFIPLFFLFYGLFIWFKTDKKVFLVLVMPLLLTLCASGLQVYPFYERLLLFLSPLLIIMIAKGCEQIMHKANHYKWAIVFPILLLVGPFITSAKEVFNTDLFGGYKKAHPREAFLFINNRFKRGDEVYIYWNMLHAYQYYKIAYKLKFKGIEGDDLRLKSKNVKDYVNNLKPQINPLNSKKRVWLIYDKRLLLNIGDYDGQDEWYHQKSVKGGKIIHQLFKKRGKKIIYYDSPDIYAALFDLSK